MGERRIGIISDTHGRLPPEVLTHFDGVEMILHAGDVGSLDVMLELETLAPVRAVSGNVDGFEFGHLPLRAVVELPPIRVGMVHGHLHGGPSDRHLRLRQAFAADSVDMILYGHTHRPCLDDTTRPWVANPGSASQGRGHGRSLAILRLGGDGRMAFDLIALD